jgi:hypothetical protein
VALKNKQNIFSKKLAKLKKNCTFAPALKHKWYKKEIQIGN